MHGGWLIQVSQRALECVCQQTEGFPVLRGMEFLYVRRCMRKVSNKGTQQALDTVLVPSKSLAMPALFALWAACTDVDAGSAGGRWAKA